MKKILGIYCGKLGGYHWDEEIILAKGGGGSETWAVEIAREFQKRGFHVILFGETERWHFAPSGVEYVPCELFERRCTYQYFDYFISSRQINELTQEICCPNVYIMSHDICMHFANSIKELKLDRVKKIGYLSNWHKEILKKWYDGLTDDKMFKTINGVDIVNYNDVDVNIKKNEMLWSSRQERGLDFFIKNIFPLIRKEVPDFQLNVCLYESEYDSKVEGVNFLGKLGKQDLCDYQKRSKIWIYPNLGYLGTDYSPFQETFCITAVENGMAKNAIICGKNGGLIDTLDGYSNLIGEEFFKKGYISSNYDMEKYIHMIANEAIKILKDDEYRIKKGEEAYNICKKYTWAEAVETWLLEWKIKF